MNNKIPERQYQLCLEDLKKICRTKLEYVKLLDEEGGFYIPPTDTLKKDYLRAVVEDEKLVSGQKDKAKSFLSFVVLGLHP